MEIGESIFIQVSASAADNKIQQLAKKSQLLPITKLKNCKTFNKTFELSALTINCNTDDLAIMFCALLVLTFFSFFCWNLDWLFDNWAIMRGPPWTPLSAVVVEGKKNLDQTPYVYMFRCLASYEIYITDSEMQKDFIYWKSSMKE